MKLILITFTVRDCEAIRLSLLPEGEKWSVIGQSFGGFCAVTYLSLQYVNPLPSGFLYYADTFLAIVPKVLNKVHHSSFSTTLCSRTSTHFLLVFTTGGMPPLVNNPDEVYRRMYLKVKSRNKVYYEKYPRDIKRVRDIMKYLENNEVFMPSEGMLTPERFLSLGLAFGGHGMALHLVSSLLFC